MYEWYEAYRLRSKTSEQSISTLFCSSHLHPLPFFSSGLGFQHHYYPYVSEETKVSHDKHTHPTMSHLLVIFFDNAIIFQAL